MRKLRKLLKVLLHIFCSFAVLVAIMYFESEIVFRFDDDEQPIQTFLEDIFMIRINEDFDRTIIGGLYYRMGYGDDVERVGSVRYFKSKAHFFDGSGEQNYEMRPLDELVDLNTWKHVGYYGYFVSTYEDAHYIYKAQNRSSEWIDCYPKDKSTILPRTEKPGPR